MIFPLLLYMLYFLFFFFFQAEDGIRDHCVTGVQTCALPISDRGGGRLGRTDRGGAVDRVCGGTVSPGHCDHLAPVGRGRSEERRVGEEGRSRGAPYH